jgi:predicted metal-binding membrane protein
MSYQGTLKRERRLVLWAMVSLAALAWAYTVYFGVQHQSMVGKMATPMMMQWSTTDVIFMFFMWAVMMFAMMLPSVTPTVLIFGRVREKRKVAGQIFAPTGAFVVGYLLVWAGFSLLATTANWSLHTGGLMSSIMGNIGPQTGGLLLVAAGVFQWTPLKNACLDHCRSPMSFLMQHWREGSSGAVLMGLHHGIYCLGCCWLLMLLLFVLGVMNLPWVALLTIIVLVEKIMPRGEILSRGLGVLLTGWGTWLIFAG